MGLNDFERRAAARAHWPGHRANLKTATDAADLSATTTASDRVAMLWELSLASWALTGQPLPVYARAEMPGRVRRRDGA